MNHKQILSALLAMVLILLMTACGQTTEPPETRVETAPAETAEKDPNPPIHSSDNGDGTFTIGMGDVMVKIVPPEGTEGKGCNAESVIIGGEDGTYIQYMVVAFAEEPNPPWTAVMEKMDDTCVRADENGIPYERQTETISTEYFDFTCDLLLLKPEGQSPRAAMLAWAPIAQVGDQSYYIQLRDFPGPSGAGQEPFDMEQLPAYLEAVVSEP